MTLIVSYASRFVQITVSDRRTTIDNVVHDEQVNKIIVFRADGQVGTIGYTGVAIIDGRPADEWLVSLMVPGLDRNPASSFRVVAIPTTLKTMVNRIVRGLRGRAAISNGFRSAYFQVGVSAVISARDQTQPYLLIITKRAHSRKLHFEIKPRHPVKPYSAFTLWISGGWGAKYPDPFLELVRTAISEGAQHRSSVEPIAKSIVKTIETLSLAEPTINSELMAVVHRPYDGFAEVSFSGSAQPRSGSLEELLFGPHSVGFTPWVLGSSMSLPPQQLIGDIVANLAGYEVRLRGGSADGDTKGFLFVQQRRRP